jgi:hypothetical protein
MSKNYKIKAEAAIIPPGPLSEGIDALTGPLDTLINLLTAASTALEAIQMFLIDISSPEKNLFLQLLQEIENLLEALKNAGIYSILIPPAVNSVKQLVTDIETRATAVQVEIDRLEGQGESRESVINSVVDFTDPYQMVPGGLYRTNWLLSQAFFDVEDKNRPIFPDTGSQVGGVILALDAPAGQFIDLFSAFLSLLGSLLDVLSSFPLDTLSPPDDFRVESLPGKVVIKFRDPTAILPPRRYQVLRSETRTGTPIQTTEYVANAPRLVYKTDKRNNFVYQWDLIEEIDVLSVFAVDDLAKRLVSDEFKVEDKTGDVEKVYYYTVRKSWHNRQSGSVETGDRATGPIAPAKPGINLKANIILATDIKENNTFGDTVIKNDQPFEDKDFNDKLMDFELIRRETLDTIEVKGSNLEVLPSIGGRVRIDKEIIYYRTLTNLDIKAGTATLSDVFRGREGTFSKKHSAGTPVELLGQYKFSRNPVEPNFFPPIKVSNYFPLIGAMADLLINILRSIAEGFKNATENLSQYIQAIQDRIDELTRDLQRIRDLLESLKSDFAGISVTAIVLPVKTQGTSQLVDRINQAFADPKIPKSSAKNMSMALGIFYGGPQAKAIETVINQMVKS